MNEINKINQGVVALISWLIIVFINFFQLVYVRYTVPGKFEWNDVIYYPVSSLTIGIFLIFIFLLPIFKRIRTIKLAFQIPLFILHGFTYTSVYIIFIFLQIALWSENLDLISFKETIHRFFYTDFHNIAKNYFFLLAIYIAVEYVNKREQTLLRQKELENQLKEVKLQALESRLHPHFIFNALNGINALVHENPRKAEEAIVELSDLLRFALEGNLQKSISIKEEIDLLRKYASIEKMRYEDQMVFKVVIDSDVDIDKKIIPPLILQPIIENSIVHGFKGINHTLSITVKVSKHCITIVNNGAPLGKDIKYNTGLNIVEQRINYHFRGSALMRIFEENGLVIFELKGINL